MALRAGNVKCGTWNGGEDTIISQSCTYRYRKASQARNNDEDRGLWMVGCGICRDNACVVRKPRENTNYQTSAPSGQGTPCPYMTQEKNNSPSLRGFVTTEWQLCERTFTWMQFPCEGTILSQSCTYRYRKASQARNNDEDRGLWMVGCGIVGTTRALSENRKKTLITRPLPPADKARLVPTSIPLPSPLSPLCTLHSVLKSPSLRGFVTTKWQLCERTFTWMQFPCEGTILSPLSSSLSTLYSTLYTLYRIFARIV